MRDLLDMINKTDETGILVTLDQEKAFDHVDHEFLMRTLAKLGFGPSFCQWVSLFHNNVFSRIICHGKLTDPVFLGRGVRQGCPLSPLLYVLISEVLSTQIRNCPDIIGFRLPSVGGLHFKISQYADDATNFVKTERSLHHLLHVVHTYERGSGAKLNTAKSEAMWLGSWRANGATPYGLKWVSKMKILGVFFGTGLVSVDQDNRKPKLDKLKSALNLCSSRRLSFVGRSLILNVLGASRFWHVAKILIPPGWVIDSYKSITCPFIWRGKMECISREQLCAPLSKGGLNIVDFSVKCTFLRSSNLASLRDSFDSEKWHFLACYFLGRRLLKYDSRFSFSSNTVPSSSMPSCYYQNCFDKLIYLFTTFSSLPDDFSCKNIYRLLLSLPRDAQRCAGFWDSVLIRPINRWATVWQKSRLKLHENKKNLLWLILHCAVRVQYSLKTWGYIDNDKCAICGRVEKIEHCFLACSRVVRVWDYFSTFLSRLNDSTFVVSIPSVFFPLSDDPSPSSPLSHFLIVTILYWLWTSRNMATFRNSTLGYQPIIGLIKNDVKARIRCAFLDSVRNFWSLRFVFCSIDNDGIITFYL